jgi:hypothetical protein
MAGTSNSLPAAPTDLRQIGIDSYGYPILTWSWGSPDESGTYTVRYQGPAPSCRWPGWDSSRPVRTW